MMRYALAFGLLVAALNVSAYMRKAVGDAVRDREAVNLNFQELDQRLSNKADRRPTDVIPARDSTFDLGGSGTEWNRLFVDTVTVTGNLNVSSMTLTNLGSLIGYKVGTFAKGTAGSTTTVTGVGFRPRLIIFFAGFGDTNSGRSGFGAMTATGQVSGAGIMSENADWGGYATNSTYAYAEYDGASLARFVSMNADGFSIVWDTVNTAITNIAYIAFQ